MKKSLETLLSEISKSIPADSKTLEMDVERYVNMDLGKLPAFYEDGSVAFYEVGGVLLGRSALIRFIEQCK